MRRFAKVGASGGFTLLELLLVLGLLVLVGAAMAGSWAQFAQSHRLQQAAAQVEQALAQARVWATEHSRAYWFAYEPGGRWLAVVPETTLAHSGQPLPAKAEQLPEEVKFESPQEPTLVPLNADQLAVLGPQGELSSLQWVWAVRFLPDGTAQDATVVLQAPNLPQVSLQVRGFTGTVRVQRSGDSDLGEQLP